MLRWSQALIHLATSVQLVAHILSRSVRGRRALPSETRRSTEEGVRTCNNWTLHFLCLLCHQGSVAYTAKSAHAPLVASRVLHGSNIATLFRSHPLLPPIHHEDLTARIITFIPRHSFRQCARLARVSWVARGESEHVPWRVCSETRMSINKCHFVLLRPERITRWLQSIICMCCFGLKYT